MTSEISELMDGELPSQTTETLIVRMKQAGGMHDDWALYHLIGDTLRQSAFYSPALIRAVSQRLSSEPTVLAPRRRSLPEKIRTYAMSAVASVAAIAVVAWIGLRGITDQPAVQVASVVPVPVPAPVQPISQPMSARMNDYLLAHHEFSPTTAVQGVASYVRTFQPEQGAR
jgi:sigma-E factor negative regulatory protein RseA